MAELQAQSYLLESFLSPSAEEAREKQVGNENITDLMLVNGITSVMNGHRKLDNAP